MVLDSRYSFYAGVVRPLFEWPDGHSVLLIIQLIENSNVSECSGSLVYDFSVFEALNSNKVRDENCDNWRTGFLEITLRKSCFVG